MRKKLAIFGLVLAAVIGGIAIAHQNKTSISRLGIPFPDLGFEGGAVLHTAHVDYLNVIGDNMGTRYEEWAAVADSTTVTHTHGLGVQFDDLGILLYTGSEDTKVTIADPAGDG